MIVIGGSLGGTAAVREILRRIPANFSPPIAIVLHRPRDGEDLLTPALQRECALPVAEAEDKGPIRPGHVYVAPADYHLMIDRSCFALSTDELVNFARPSIDVLFESAAEWNRRSVIAVVLTGGGTDGAEGARRIDDCGGTVLVQAPQTAEGPWMPAAAIKRTTRARILSLEQIASDVVELAASHSRGLL